MKAEDFYFQLIHCPQTEPDYVFLVTPRLYYDSEGCLSDEGGIADEVMPNGFGELMESHYEYNGNAQVGRQILLDAGFVEIDFGFNNPVLPNQPGDDEEDYHEEEANEEDYSNEKYEQDIDYLLKHGESKPLSYKDASNEKLLRHLKIMLMSDSFEDAAKIRDELLSRGVTEF